VGSEKGPGFVGRKEKSGNLTKYTGVFNSRNDQCNEKGEFNQVLGESGRGEGGR